MQDAATLGAHFASVKVLALATVVVFVLVIFTRPSMPVDVWQEAAFAFDPTAERAFQYGTLRFSSQHPYLYNVDRAEYFLSKAAEMNPDLPHLFHELARISFLKGEQLKALSLIDLQIAKHGDTLPNSYYVRGLIEGYMGKYKEAALDYEQYLLFDPTNWAATNDYAWVLLKDGRSGEALAAIEALLPTRPDNPWLLNSAAIAAHELGDDEKARTYAERAMESIQGVTEIEWLLAYPGNDPRIAGEGIATLRKSIVDNIHTITVSTGQSAL